MKTKVNGLLKLEESYYLPIIFRIFNKMRLIIYFYILSARIPEQEENSHKNKYFLIYQLVIYSIYFIFS